MENLNNKENNQIINEIRLSLSQLYFQDYELENKIKESISDNLDFESFYIISTIWLNKYKKKFNYDRLSEYLSKSVLKTIKIKKIKKRCLN